LSWFNNFIGRLSFATKPRPEKLANFIDRLTRPYQVVVRSTKWLELYACYKALNFVLLTPINLINKQTQPKMHQQQTFVTNPSISYTTKIMSITSSFAKWKLVQIT